MWMTRIIFGLILSSYFASLYSQSPKLHLPEDQVVYFNTYELQKMDSIPMLDSVLGRYRFFFTAEEHWLDINTQITRIGDKSITLSHEIVKRSNQEIVVDGDVTFVVKDLRKGVAVPITGRMRDMFMREEA